MESNKENIFGFNVIKDKNIVEVGGHNMSGILSPIDLKESNRDISTKLDELYKSYETKEKLFGSSSLLRQVQLDEERNLEEEDRDNTKETPLRKVNDFFK